MAAISPRRMAVSMAHDDLAYLPTVGLGGDQEPRPLISDEAAVASLGELGTLAFHEIHGVGEGLHAPGGAGDVEQVGEEGEIQADGVRACAPRRAVLYIGHNVFAPDTRQGTCGQRA